MFSHPLAFIQDGKSLDAAHTGRASKHRPIDYPPFEVPLSTDLMTSVALTGTNHAENQPVHLRVMKMQEFMQETKEGGGSKSADRVAERQQQHVKVNVDEYAGLLEHACPAGVYEYVDIEVGGMLCLSLSWVDVINYRLKLKI